MKTSNPCKYCDQVGHTSMTCFIKPKNRSLKPKVMRQVGKVGREWLKTRAEWFRQHPADHYYCYIDNEQLTPKETTLDHIKSRGRYPELRFNLSNLAPCCYRHNRDKGSLSLEEYLLKLDGVPGDQIKQMKQEGLI